MIKTGLCIGTKNTVWTQCSLSLLHPESKISQKTSCESLVQKSRIKVPPLIGLWVEDLDNLHFKWHIRHRRAEPPKKFNNGPDNLFFNKI